MLNVFSIPLVAFQCAMKKSMWNAIVVLGNSSDAKVSFTHFFVSDGISLLSLTCSRSFAAHSVALSMCCYTNEAVYTQLFYAHLLVDILSQMSDLAI